MEFVVNIINTMLSSDVLTKSLLLFVIYKKILYPNYILHRAHLVSNPKKVMLPPQIIEKHKEMTDEELYERKLDERIIVFKKVLRENLTKEQRILFNNNIKNLDIKNTLKSNISKKLKEKNIGIYKYLFRVGGRYLPKDNTIMIYNDAMEIVIYHELFHMASCNNKMYVGLLQKNKNNILGNGINEGVTQYLTEKYFADKMPDDILVYPFETHIVRCLNLILDKSVIIDAYFSADLNKLVNEISKYTSRRNALKFIEHLDVVNRFTRRNNMFLFKRKDAIQNSIYFINELLKEMYLKKLFMKNTYTDEERESMYLSFVSFLYNNKFYEYCRFNAVDYNSYHERGR